MKKTLLIAAAALAASVISSQAQVYSQNVVGYYNVTVAPGKFVLVGNQLNLDNTNSISSIFTGLFSDANAVTNTAIWLWNQGSQQYSSYQFYTGADADNQFLLSGAVNGFYDTSGDYITTPLGVGAGAFLQNLALVPVTATVVGTVAQGTNLVTLGHAFTLVASPIPVSTNIASGLEGFVGVSDPNAVTNDVAWVWNAGVQQYSSYQFYTGADADNQFLLSGAVNGFYDTSGDYINLAPLVGNGFFIQHVVAGSETWTNTFTVQ
jgi:hypothetical protein